MSSLFASSEMTSGGEAGALRPCVAISVANNTRAQGARISRIWQRVVAAAQEREAAKAQDTAAG